ncbi:MAG: hypothetical protein N2445_02395 [Acidobacteria bacterium]|nr:hypothetical protein [Acidobacteriota bacterium]
MKKTAFICNSVALAILLFLSAISLAAQDVCIVYQKGTPLFEETAEIVKMSLSPKSYIPLEKDKEEEAKTAISIDKDALMALTGPNAITVAFQAGVSKGVAVGLPNPLSKAYSAKKDFAFVTLYPEMKSILEFLAKYYSAKTIGLIYTNSVNQEMGDYFKNQIESSGFKCKTLGVDVAQDLVSPFPFFLGQVDVALILIDPLAYNKEAVKFMVTKAIEKKKPIIGFSEQVPSAGIPLAMFVNSQILSETVVKAVKEKKSGTSSLLYFSPNFKLSINEEACKAIGVRYDETKVTKKF